MKKRILVSNQPKENEIRCEYCNKIIETKKYKAHLKQIHEIGVKKKVVKANGPGPVMGVNPETDQNLMLLQSEFEKELSVICPLCGKDVVSKELKVHLEEEHKHVSADDIGQILTDKSLTIICPLCGIIIASPVRHHFRKVHFLDLETFAKGIFETADTIKNREDHLAYLRKVKMALTPDKK